MMYVRWPQWKMLLPHDVEPRLPDLRSATLLIIAKGSD
jgi:hypothetical protein